MEMVAWGRSAGVQELGETYTMGKEAYLHVLQWERFLYER